jgi:epoxyqueuosine reductase
MTSKTRLQQLRTLIDQWATELGFSQAGVTDTDVESYKASLDSWLEAGYQGDMAWMQDRRSMRLNPDALLGGTVRVIALRMPYFQPETQPLQVLENSDKAYISRYALGRDYHKLMRQRLAQLAERILDWWGEPLAQRPFVDSAPVLEKPFAEKAGLGWIGKNTLLLGKDSGSWHFLGEIYTSLELPLDEMPVQDQCGKCRACLKVCPTDAFPQPYVLDARRCISYLTIEHAGSIPEEFREPMGNRVFGCDDCQLVCPWNRESPQNREDDFQPRHQLDNSDLVELFDWTEEEFLQRTAGSPIRRIGYERWQRNLAIGLGNSNNPTQAIPALTQKNLQSALIQEHIEWAIKQLTAQPE